MTISSAHQPPSRFTPAQRRALAAAYAVILRAAERADAGVQREGEELMHEKAASERLAAGSSEKNYVDGHHLVYT